MGWINRTDGRLVANVQRTGAAVLAILLFMTLK
jgi:hypothetical protein